MEAAVHILRNMDWNMLFHGARSVDDYERAFMGVMDIAVPYVTVGIPFKQKLRKSVLSKNIIKLIHQKRRLWQAVRVVNNGLPRCNNLVMKYKIVCRNLRRQIKLHRRSKILVAVNSKDPNLFYKYVRSATSKQINITELCDAAGRLVKSDQDIASLFNDVFATHYVTSTSDSNNVKLDSFSSEQKDDSHDNCAINVSYEDILRILCNVPFGSPGPDGITGEIIKKLAPLIARPLHMHDLSAVHRSRSLPYKMEMLLYNTHIQRQRGTKRPQQLSSCQFRELVWQMS